MRSKHRDAFLLIENRNTQQYFLFRTRNEFYYVQPTYNQLNLLVPVHCWRRLLYHITPNWLLSYIYSSCAEQRFNIFSPTRDYCIRLQVKCITIQAKYWYEMIFFYLQSKYWQLYINVSKWWNTMKIDTYEKCERIFIHIRFQLKRLPTRHLMQLMNQV